MKRFYIGIDTSNYTTSCALYEAEEKRFYSNVKQILTVAEGERGLRQSNALFAHIKNLPDVTKEALCQIEAANLCAVGVSSKPRDAQGSYMPCFLAGVASANTLANAMHKPLYSFSHQAGHIMAAVYSSGAAKLLDGEFYAFHLSGGTTELLRVKPSYEDNFSLEISKTGGSLDLNAGQVIDRSGVLMGLRFPCGAELEKLALANTEPLSRSPVSVKGCECNLSGVENKVLSLLKDGKSREYISTFVLDFVGRTVISMCRNAIAGYGDKPVLFAGGVMSNSIIKAMIGQTGLNAYFAKPEFSSDNAAGVALLAAVSQEGMQYVL